MRVITITHIKKAMLEYPQWRVGLQIWLSTFNRPSLKFDSFRQIQELWRNQSGWNIDRVPSRKVTDCAFQGDNYDVYIFDVHGTNCRIVCRIDSVRHKIFIRGVFSHAEYDKWVKQNIK